MVQAVSDERRREALLVEFIKYQDKAVKAKELAPALGLNPDWSYTPVRALVKSLNDSFVLLARKVAIVETPKGYIYTENPAIVREALETAEKRLKEQEQEVEDVRAALRRLAGTE